LIRRITLLTVWTAVAAIMLAAPLGASGGFPERISLPDRFRPEGIAIGPRGMFYVGSIPTGAIYRGNLRTGEGSTFIPGIEGVRAAIGVEYDHGLLFVAGGGTGKGFVYSARSGDLLAEPQLAVLPIDDANPTFINDVAVARGGAYFTDSRRPFLYRFGPGGVERIPLTGDIVYQAGNNANGIEATPDGKTLIIVQSNVGKVFTVDPSSGETEEIALGQTVVNGDGLLLDGKNLYVVQNRDNKVAVFRLSPSLDSGTLTVNLTDPDFDVPTTIDEFGKRLYAVNARFRPMTEPQETVFWLAQFRKASGH
jgi:sugar lactone lactonase YvrE